MKSKKEKLKKLFVAFILFVSCFGLAIPKEIEAKTASSQKIVVKRKQKNEYKKEVKQIKKQFNKLPKSYTGKCNKVYLMDNKTFTKKAKSFEVEKASKINGFASYENQSIYIRLKEGKSIKFYTKTLIHELAHIYDFAESDSESEGKYTSDTEFINIFQSNPNSINKYGASNIEEFFAEASYLYFQKPDKLMLRNYQVYEYLNNIYQVYN